MLSPEEVHAIARPDGSELIGGLFVTAAFTGMRLGELRAPRWPRRGLRQAPGARAPKFHRQLVRRPQVAARPQRAHERPGRTVLDGLSRRDHDTRPDDLVFSLGDDVPFHHNTARKRFYVALAAAGLGRLRAKADPIAFHDLQVRHAAVQAFRCRT